VSRDQQGSDHFLTFGVTDLMTSLAIVFVLLFLLAVQPTPIPHVSAQPVADDLRDPVQHHFERLGLPVERDAEDSQLLLLIMPESLLNFDFGQATLRPAAEEYLRDAIPRYATALCGPFRSLIESVTIEGHTDDVGDARRNLRLSQERAFRVMVRAMEILQDRSEGGCFQELATASGRGQQDLLYDLDHRLNRDKSRRVVLKLRLRSPSSMPAPAPFRSQSAT
jgi:outer membrane protein OmpA-like peptidoglycan-associated protein